LPTIVVTHDPIDARILGKCLVVLESGRVTQFGTWDDLVAAPASRFVEEFVAAGLDGSVVADDHIHGI
jgi:molybdate transport system ATP-binding protein